jgi:DNA-binding NtrC family response regulator
MIESSEFAQAQSLLSNGLDPDLLLVESTAAGPSETVQFRQLIMAAPKHRTCLILGIGEQSLRKEASELGIKHLLTKPLTRGDIESMVDEIGHSFAAGGGGNAGLLPRENAACTTSSPANTSEVLHLEELGENRFFLAASPRMLEIRRQIKVLADVDVPVLILGESGTGKEVIARLLHKHSRRSREKFLNVNCAALPSELIESELFGHCQGAFTGALRDKPGKFEQANRGTLLLDEIGEISVQMQAKLLHVLQDGSFTRIGGQEPTKVNVRILAATNIDMEGALLEKTFREDLYYRLNTFTIHVPPLRERREEIPCLIEEIIRRIPGETKNCSECGFCSRLMDAALIYDWRGNLRELHNFVTRTVIMRDPDSAIRELEKKISAKSGAAYQGRSVSAASHSPALRSLVRDVKDRTEVKMIQDALELSGWNRRRAAQYLNISYRGLLYKIKQHRLTPRDINEDMRKSYSTQSDAV